MTTDKPTPEPIYPGHPQPPGRGRVDVNPSDEPGIDELPNNEGELPRDREEWETWKTCRIPIRIKPSGMG